MTKSVFISSTAKDLMQHRAAVNEVLNRIRMRAIDMKYFGSAPGGAVGVSLDEVRQADFYIGIVAHRFGYVPDTPAGNEKSVTEQEYDEAVRLKMPRFLYVVDPAYQWPDEFIEKDDLAQQRLKAFKSRIDANEVRTLFTTPEDLAQKVAADMARELTRQRRQRRISFVMIFVLIVAVVAAASILLFPDQISTALRRVGVLPPVPMLQGTDPGGSINVLVTRLGEMNADGLLTETQVSRDIASAIDAQVSQIEELNDYRGPDDIGVGAVLGTTPALRREQAWEMARIHNATIVVYGYVRPRGDQISVDFVPEFYIAVRAAQMQPEITEGATALVQPVQLLLDMEDTSELNYRLNALREFLNGISAFIHANYPGARDAFDRAIAQSPSTEVLYIFAGNTAARMNDRAAELSYYTRSLADRPQYSRGLLGRGRAFFDYAVQRALVRRTPYNPDFHMPSGTRCLDEIGDPEQVDLMVLLDMARICYEEAAASPDQPEGADMDVKIPFERATLFLWRSQNGYGEFNQQVSDDLETVITLYGQALPEHQARIHIQGGLAYAFRAYLTLATTQDTVAALADFNEAIRILRREPNQDNALPMINTYQTQVATLEAATPTP